MPEAFPLVTLIWLTVGVGLLFYFPPLSTGARRMRIAVLAGVVLSLAFLVLHVGVPMTAGVAYVEIGLPIGRGLRLPYRFGYFFFWLWPILGIVSLAVAAVGPAIYLVKTRKESS